MVHRQARALDVLKAQAVALGVPIGVVQQTSLFGNLRTLIQGKQAERSLAQAQQKFQTSFNKSFTEQATNLNEQLARTFERQQQKSLLSLRQKVDFAKSVDAPLKSIKMLEPEPIKSESEQKVETKINIIPLLLIGAALLG